MDKFLIFTTLAILVSLSVYDSSVSAQELPDIPKVVETVGQNYDLTENYIIGEATWTSHTERIFDGTQWVDFIVYESGNTVQIESNQVGSISYDKNACAYTIFDNGNVTPNENPLIPSVSWMPRIAEVGTDNYSEITDLYNAQCDVEVTQGENWVNIKSVKTLDEDLPPIIVNHVNGTQSVYPNGVTTIATLVQTLDITHERGIKETVSIFNGNPSWDNHKMALTQTVHTPDTVSLGGNDYNIASMDGQTLDKQWIVDNKAEIFEIADSLNYDFDIGIDELNAITFVSEGGFFDSTQKIAMDFSVNDSTPYLSSYTVDPTFTSPTQTEYMTYTGNHYSSTCDENTTNWNTGTTNYWNMYIERGVSSAGWCVFPSFKFDISSMPSDALVSQVDFGLDISYVGTPRSCQLNQMSTDPATTYQTVSPTRPHVIDILDGNSYASDDSFCETTGLKSVTLSSDANTDLQNQVSAGWFGVGMYFEDTSRVGSNVYRLTYNTPTLTATYILPTQPSSPTNLSAVSGQPIELSWTASTDLGGVQTADMTYKVERSTYEFAEQPLPINAGSDSGVNMSTNVLLYHLDATKTDSSTTSATISQSGTGENKGLGQSQSGSDSTKQGFDLQSGHSAVGTNPATISVYLWTSGSPSGNGSMKIYDSSGTLQATSTNTVDWSTLGSSSWGTKTDFTFSGYTIQGGDRIMIEGGTTNDSNRVYLSMDTSSASNTQAYYYTNSWNTYSQPVKFDIVHTITTTSDPYLEDTSGQNNDSENPSTPSTLTTYDFSSTPSGWTELDSAKAGITGGEFYWKSISDNSNDSAYVPVGDLGDDWIIRMKVDSVAYNDQWALSSIALVEDTTTSGNSGFGNGQASHWIDQNNIGVFIGERYASGNMAVRAVEAGSIIVGGSEWGSNKADLADNGSTVYLEMKLTGGYSGGTFTANTYTDDTYTTQYSGGSNGAVTSSITTGTCTGTSSCQNDSANLTYLKFSNPHSDQVGNTSAYNEVNIDDLQICKGTSMSACEASQPSFSTGTIANQIDSPQLTVKSTTLYDGTDSHSLGGWTKAIGDTTTTHMDTLSETISSDQWMNSNSGGATNMRGEKVETTSSALYDIIPNKVTMKLKKQGSPTGDISVLIVDSGGSTLHTIGTIDSSTLTTTYTDYTVTNTALTYKLAEDDRIVAYFPFGDNSNSVSLGNSGSNVFDGTDTVKTFRDTVSGNVWMETSGTDSIMKVQTFSAGSTGTMFSFENTSGENILYEVEADKLRVAKSVETTNTTPDYSWDQGTGACGIENTNEAYVCGIDVTTNSVLVGTDMKKIEVQMWVNNQNKAGKIWAGVVTPTWDRGDMGNNNGADWSNNQVLADFGWLDDVSTLHYCASSCLDDKTQLTTVTFTNEAGYVLGSSGSDEIIVFGHPSNAQGNGYVGIPYTDSSTNFDGGNTCKASAWGNQHWNNDCSTHTNREIDFEIFSSLTTTTKTNIIEATGQTISTSTPSHIQFNRGTSNDWSIWLDGTSVATATDSTSLGTINTDDEYFIGQTPTGTNTLPSLDEFYVFTSDKSSEASDIYDRGANQFAQVGSTTGSTVEFDDSNVSSGNEYFHRIIANNGAFNSEPSNVSSSTAGVPPDSPTISNISINDTDASPLDITLTISNGSSMGTGSFSNYIITRSADSTFTTSQNVGTPTTTTFTDTVPSSGQWYYKAQTQTDHGISALSSSVNTTTPTEPNPPASVTVTIQDADSNPFDTTVTYTVPSSDGGSSITGYKVYRDSTLLATLGNVLTYSDTVPSTSGTSYLYEVSSLNNVGESLTKTSFTHTSPTVPSAVSDLAGQADSDTEATLTWTEPSTGGSAIIRYDIVQDGSIVDNTTNLTYTRTGLTQGTSYAFNVIAVNNIGSSTNSNTVNITTHTPVTGTISGNAITDGVTVELTVTPNITSGSPTPSFQTYTIKEGSTVIQTFTGTVYYLQLQDGLAHNYTVESTDSNHWNNPTITGSFSVQADYEPDWKNSLSYNYTRSGGTWQSYVNRADTNNWDIYCTYRTTDEVIANQAGISSTATGVWGFNETQSIPSTKTVYWECKENANSTDLYFTTTSFATDRLGGGILLLDNIFEDWTGTPVALFFILLVAGLFTGRSAPTGILLILAVVGIMGFIGMLTIDEATFGFVLLAGILGIFVGKRFL